MIPGQSGNGKAAREPNGAWVEQPLPYSSIQDGATYTLDAWGRSLTGKRCNVCRYSQVMVRRSAP